MKRLIQKFLKSGKSEGEWIELDNLDKAKLVRYDDKTVLVENEHGTRFDITELSDAEINAFLISF